MPKGSKKDSLVEDNYGMLIREVYYMELSVDLGIESTSKHL